MRRIPSRIALAFILYLAAGSQQGYSQAILANGAIGAQVLGRVRIQPDLSVKLYGYFTYLAGVPGSIFAGVPSENTAMLTYAADPTSATLIRNGDIVQGVESPVNSQYTVLSIYYNPNATSRNILNPDDFAQGQLIAKFRSRASVVNVSASGTFQATSGITLDTANYFFIHNQPVNLGSIANALSLTLFGPAPSFDAIAAGLLSDGSFSIPLAGTGYIVSSMN
jgi:hypothetical protein